VTADRSPLSALRHVAISLASLGRRYALVGGVAVTVRSEVRFTRDVDIAVAVEDDADAESLIFDLRDHGYVAVATVEHAVTGRLATARLRGPSGVVCDLLFASSGIESEVVGRATPIEVDVDLTVPVARVEELLALKVLSATPRRPQDGADFLRLIDFNPDFDEAAVRTHVEAIRSRRCHRDQDLLAKFDEMLRTARDA